MTALLRRMLAKDAGTRPDAAAVVREFETLLRGTTDAADEVDFDDFRDELAAGRSVPVATASARPKQRQWKAPRKEVLIGIVAAIALVVLVPILLRPGNESPATRQPPSPVATPASQAPPATETPTIQLDPPQDKGTTVLLKWSFSKPLTYAVFVAEQGAKAPRAMYRGSGTTLTVQVSQGLTYCFEVQGTDGREVFYSKPTSIRGATCKS
ncbi:hypothetical protein GCM10029976_052430 [Kribbella albertanoniae]